MHFWINTHHLLLFAVAVLYSYQMGYMILVVLHDVRQKLRKKTSREPEKPVVPHRFAAIISARNEENVIGQLLDTINNQKYPEDMRHAIVIADNCTDNTAAVARAHGATVLERFNPNQVGKGYALNYAFRRIAEQFGDSYFDAYIIIDADNLLEENYFAEMNKTFSKGYRIMTSYRNSKNFDENWIAAGYAIAFLREAKFLNNARMMLKTSCAVSGTGFLVASEVIRERAGWNYHLLTEDIEFTVDSVIRGERIGYCGTAMLYDEQPTTFQQSWNQRMRWSRGFYQIVLKYGKTLSRGVVHPEKKQNRFTCFDLTMTVIPMIMVTIALLLTDLAMLSYSIFGPVFMPHLMTEMLHSLTSWVTTYYMALFCMGALTMVSEWKKIKCPLYKRVWYTITYPLFMMTYIPISVAALFGKVEWKPIQHRVAKTLDEVR
ncbi:MAG: glycosyltransferase family 2 protein [Eubacteriales bacterium]|nr:glycosyltransferase family 2 protein [Eubacteriales bacterium]